jgi:hypothetical protein
MRRRDFVTLLGTSAAAWPLAARAQQRNGRVRRIGIFDIGDESDPFIQSRWDATRDELARLGWIEGRNVRLDRRFSADDPNRMRANADEWVRLAPDVIAVASGPASLRGGTKRGARYGASTPDPQQSRIDQPARA